jgi:hypothetical protein
MGIATEMHGAAKPQAAPSAAEHAEPGGESLLEMAQPQWIDQPSRIEHIESEDEDEKKNRYQRQSWITLRFGSPLDWPFAPPIRFFLGMIILAGFALWWQQSKGDAAYVLQLPSLPPVIGKMLSGWNASVAGVILLLSSFARGKLLGLSIYLAAAIALVGHWYPLPNIGQITPRISAIAAGVVAFLGLFFFRVPDGI